MTMDKKEELLRLVRQAIGILDGIANRYDDHELRQKAEETKQDLETALGRLHL